MTRSIVILTAISLAASAVAVPAKANDAVAGGVLGFMGGMIVGNAIARPHYGPRYSYVEEEAPLYCHWERRTYFDDYEGVYRRHRVRVCD